MFHPKSHKVSYPKAGGVSPKFLHKETEYERPFRAPFGQEVSREIQI